MNCYTLEASFCGPNRGAGHGFHFGIRDLEGIGGSLLTAVHKWHNACATPTAWATAMEDLEAHLAEMGDEGGSDGSDSDPCEGNLPASALEGVLDQLIQENQGRRKQRRLTAKKRRKVCTPSLCVPPGWEAAAAADATVDPRGLLRPGHRHEPGRVILGSSRLPKAARPRETSDSRFAEPTR